MLLACTPPRLPTATPSPAGHAKARAASAARIYGLPASVRALIGGGGGGGERLNQRSSEDKVFLLGLHIGSEGCWPVEVRRRRRRRRRRRGASPPPRCGALFRGARGGMCSEFFAIEEELTGNVGNAQRDDGNSHCLPFQMIEASRGVHHWSQKHYMAFDGILVSYHCIGPSSII